MKSSQLNFYLLDSDISLIEQYLKENNFGFGAYPMPRAAILEADFLGFFDDKIFSSKKIFLKKQENLLTFEKSDEKFWFNDLYLPIISYQHGFFDSQNQILKKGRFFYQKGFYDEKGTWKEKDKEFLRAADKFFRWFKSNFKKSDITHGNYSSISVLDFIRNGGLLQQF